MANQIDNVACTVCGCVCDDLRVTVEAGRIVRAEHACSLAEPWFLAQNSSRPASASIEGQPVSLSAGLDRAAGLLRNARSPLVFGLSRSSTAGQQAAIALADRIGATVDTTASLGHAPAIMALMESGESTCTLGEVKNRADLVIFWGSNPVESHPRHFERYSVDPKGLFIPTGRKDRFLVVADVRETPTTVAADLFLPIEAGRDFEALWTLRTLVKGREPEAGTVVGAPLDRLRQLAQRMKQCRFGVIFFGLGLSRNGPHTVEALLRLGLEVNAFSRFYVRRMRVSGDVAGADSVLAWQTGFPFSVNLARGYPRFNPGEFTARDMLLRGEVDICLLVGTGGLRRFNPEAVDALKRIPTIVLDSPGTEPPLSPTVRFTTAIYGIHRPGTVYRMDEVPIPVKGFLASDYPSDEEVLRELYGRIVSQANDQIAQRC